LNGIKICIKDNLNHNYVLDKRQN